MTADQIVVLGCGKAKRVEVYDHELPLGPDAENPVGYRTIQLKRLFPLVELYIGPLFRARLAYARALGGPHWVVSAFHGCRRPDYPSGPYERTINRDNRAWFHAVTRDTLLRYSQPNDRIIALASSDYVKEWAQELRERGRIVELPLRGMGIGQQLKWLKTQCSDVVRAVEDAENPNQLNLWEEMG